MRAVHWLVISVLIFANCAPVANRSLGRAARSLLTGSGTTTSGGGGGGGGGGSGKFEIPIEMLDHGITSNGAPASNVDVSATSLDTTEYDGTVTYVWEVVASNDDVVAQAITLINNAAAVVGTINVSAGAVAKRFSVVFTPTAGANRYRVSLPDTSGLQTVSIYTSRIRVQQTSATLTRVSIPLVASGVASLSSVNALPNSGVDVRALNTYGQSTPQSYGVWRRDTSNLATIPGGANSPWKFEVVMSAQMGVGNCYASLYNKTTGSQIAASEASVAATTIHQYLSVTFQDSAANFTEGDDIEVRIKNDNGVSGCTLNHALLSVALTSVSKTESWYRFSREVNLGATAMGFQEEQRVLLDTSLFGTPTAYVEAHGWDPVNGGSTSQLYDSGVLDTGAVGAGLTSVVLPIARGRIRSVGSPALTDNDRYLLFWNNPGAGAAKIIQSFVVIQNQ